MKARNSILDRLSVRFQLTTGPPSVSLTVNGVSVNGKNNKLAYALDLRIIDRDGHKGFVNVVGDVLRESTSDNDITLTRVDTDLQRRHVYETDLLVQVDIAAFGCRHAQLFCSVSTQMTCTTTRRGHCA